MMRKLTGCYPGLCGVRGGCDLFEYGIARWGKPHPTIALTFFEGCKMRNCWRVLFVLVMVLSVGFCACGETWKANRFCAFVNCFSGGSYSPPQVRVQILKDLGYDGISYSGINGIAEYLEALDGAGLVMFNSYIGVNLDAGQKYDPKLKDAIASLKGRETMIWLNVRGLRNKRATEEGDRVAVEVIREIADMGHESGLKVALYPHAGFYVESVDDSIRLVAKINRRNVGATFNLCHWLKVEGDKDYKPILERAKDILFQVSINGADGGDTKRMGWDRLIQPLGKGSYDVESLLVALKGIGYTGPIGLQGYAVKGDSKANLKQSIQAWRKLSDKLKSN